MPIPAAPTLMLVIGAMMLVVSRWVKATRWFEGVWLASVAATVWLIASGGGSDFSVWSTDSFAVVGQLLALGVVAVLGAGSFGIDSLYDRNGERFGFLSFLVAGLMLVACANDAIAMALSLEIVQFASFALRKLDPLERGEAVDRFPKTLALANQSVLSIGAISTLLLWLGIALLSHVTSSTQYDQIRLVFADAFHPGLNRIVIGTGSKLGLLGIGLMVAGLGTRIGLVPWQLTLNQQTQGVGYWTAGCCMLAGQLSGIIALSRLCGTVWIGYRNELIVLLMAIAGLTFVVAGSLSLLGLMPEEGRVDRWLISFPMLHGAWLTLGLTNVVADMAASEQSLAAIPGQPCALALLLFATCANFCGLAGLFLVFSHLSSRGRKVEFVNELMGLGQLAPACAAAMTILLASLAGQPPLWGFWSHWLLTVAGFNVRFAGGRSAVSPHMGILALLAVGTIATLMAMAVTIRFTRVAFLELPVSRSIPRGKQASLVAACICAAAIVIIGVFPGRFLAALTVVHGPETISNPDIPPGSNRGQPTAGR